MTPLRMLQAALLSVAIGAAGEAAAQTKPDAKPTPAPAASPKAESSPIYDQEADGELTLKFYADVCKRSNRYLIVFFGTNDCIPCRAVNQGVFEERFYRELVKQFVPAFIDVSPGSANAEMPSRYGIDPKAPYPGVVIFEPTGGVKEVVGKGEMAAVARKGKEAVQLWILARFDRNRPPS
ncbi:MAG TPA: thioredoxin family protein [Thermoanaerobaculia bacterium]|nr:thioredoxin family protein [Thermoanaerobaculia bacterium]